jgi:hypothetical protein
MMTGQPRRVTPADIADLLDTALRMGSGATLDEQLACHERKARLLSGVAADLGTAEAHLVAAEAWQYASELAARRRQQDSAEVTP